ncbi:MAG: ABC transporter ATP-binding protein [Ruminiclostridium sp.]|nr:ABC transporter ATP-binding protein [Ruminiclostridium sp.]
MEKYVEAVNLVYHYGDIHAVNDISFSVRKGEILGFLGPNGAGKSTTIQMLTGQLKPKSGSAKILGMDVHKTPREVKHRFGVCFEQPNLYEQLTAKENLVFFARLFRLSGFSPEKLLDKVGLGDRMNEKVSKYSKGMKQRLMLARALINTPDVLFLDEPASGLDPVSAQALRNIIFEEKQRGSAILLTTHDMVDADKLSDRVAFINGGKIAALDTPYNLKLQFGQKMLLVEAADQNGSKKTLQLPIDLPSSGEKLREIFENKTVLTVHSKEASLEDIFIRITGRGLAG